MECVRAKGFMRTGGVLVGAAISSGSVGGAGEGAADGSEDEGGSQSDDVIDGVGACICCWCANPSRANTEEDARGVRDPKPSFRSAVRGSSKTGAGGAGVGAGTCMRAMFRSRASVPQERSTISVWNC